MYSFPCKYHCAPSCLEGNGPAFIHSQGTPFAAAGATVDHMAGLELLTLQKKTQTSLRQLYHLGFTVSIIKMKRASFFKAYGIKSRIKHLTNVSGHWGQLLLALSEQIQLAPKKFEWTCM